MTEGTQRYDLTPVLKYYQKDVGKELELTEDEAFLANCPIEASEIRRFALATEDGNPLWLDNEYAKKTRWGGIIAPPTFLIACGGQHALAPESEVEQFPGFILQPLFSGSEFEFYHPVRVSDNIRPKSKIVDVYEKVGRFVGTMIFRKSETTYTNQDDKLVGIWRQLTMTYAREDAKERERYNGGNTLEEQQIMRVLPSRKVPVTARGATPLYYEDVTIGAELPPLVKKLTITGIVAQAQALRQGIYVPCDESPGIGCHWHYLPHVAWEMVGFPSAFDFGYIRSNWSAQLLTDWIGDDGWLSKLTVQIRSPVLAGDTITNKGTVINKYVEGNQHLVECEIWMENQRGDIPLRGNATVILPSRSQ